MKTKGIGTSVVVMIIVILAIVGIGTYFFMKGEEEIGEESGAQLTILGVTEGKVGEELTFTVTSNDEPVEGVIVEIAGERKTTGTDGTVTFILNEAGNYVVTATKEGYKRAFGTAVVELPDITPPTISYVGVTMITESSARIFWTTSEPSNSIVNYGMSAPLGLTKSDSKMVTNHTIMLIGLDSRTVYYFEVKSTDNAGNTSIDDNSGSYYSFNTLPNISWWDDERGQRVVNLIDSYVRENLLYIENEHWYFKDEEWHGTSINPYDMKDNIAQVEVMIDYWNDPMSPKKWKYLIKVDLSNNEVVEWIDMGRVY